MHTKTGYTQQFQCGVSGFGVGFWALGFRVLGKVRKTLVLTPHGNMSLVTWQEEHGNWSLLYRIARWLYQSYEPSCYPLCIEINTTNAIHHNSCL